MFGILAMFFNILLLIGGSFAIWLYTSDEMKYPPAVYSAVVVMIVAAVSLVFAGMLLYGLKSKKWGFLMAHLIWQVNLFTFYTVNCRDKQYQACFVIGYSRTRYCVAA